MTPLIFQHTFSNGQTITMRIERRENQIPKFTSDRYLLKGTHDAEYEAWRLEVFNQLYSEMTEDERLACAIYGGQCK